MIVVVGPAVGPRAGGGLPRAMTTMIVGRVAAVPLAVAMTAGAGSVIPKVMPKRPAGAGKTVTMMIVAVALRAVVVPRRAMTTMIAAARAVAGPRAVAAAAMTA